MDNEQLEFVKQIARRLDAARIPYMLTGSVAMALYATPRMTRDVDVVVACGSGDAEKMVRLFESDCYVDKESVRDAIARRSMFNIIHNDWVIKADFIVRKDEEYRRVEFGRRRRIDIEGVSVFVVAPEDLLLSKLCWGKDSGSELQREDARAIAESAADLDWPYIEKWALVLGINDSLVGVRNG